MSGAPAEAAKQPEPAAMQEEDEFEEFEVEGERISGAGRLDHRVASLPGDRFRWGRHRAGWMEEGQRLTFPRPRRLGRPPGGPRKRAALGAGQAPGIVAWGAPRGAPARGAPASTEPPPAAPAHQTPFSPSRQDWDDDKLDDDFSQRLKQELAKQAGQ